MDKLTVHLIFYLLTDKFLLMKISIITATYNSEKFISTCIHSVISQSYDNIEYIVVDGNSTDSTMSIVKQYPQIKYVSEKDDGIYDAMNKGIKLATGDVIGILNSDDLYQDSEVIKNVMAEFIADPDLDAVYGNLVYVKNGDISKVVRKWKSLDYYPRFFDNGNVPPHPTLFLRSKVYKQAGLFRLQYNLSADYEFMLRIFKKFNIKSKYIDRLMVRMRLGGATNKNFVNIINGNKEIWDAWKTNNLKMPVLLMPIKIFKRLIQFF